MVLATTVELVSRAFCSTLICCRINSDVTGEDLEMCIVLSFDCIYVLKLIVVYYDCMYMHFDNLPVVHIT